MKIITSLFTLLFLFNAYGQDDPHSQKIIDDMTARFKTYPSVSISFSATIQFQDQSETEQEGKLWVKNNKYKLELPEFVIFFDGAKIYQYLPEAKEVNVTKPDPNEDDEDFQLLNPQTYFNLSSKSFKSKLGKESTMSNRKVSEIDLYPIQFTNSKYLRIRVMVEKTTLQLVYLKVFMKDGTHYTLSFKPYDVLPTALPDSFFTFNKLKNPDVEVIDLTF
jgi:outer membrane lipoprotein-sorting protein